MIDWVKMTSWLINPNFKLSMLSFLLVIESLILYWNLTKLCDEEALERGGFRGFDFTCTVVHLNVLLTSLIRWLESNFLYLKDK